MKKTAILIFFFCVCLKGNAQNSVSGRVVDSTNAGIEFATVAILNFSDSTVVQSTLADQKGNFALDSVHAGNYLVKVFFVGYKDLYMPVVVNGNTNTLPTFTLKNAGVNLNEVTVSALKKLVEFKNGNITVNIEDSPLAIGNSAWDLLTRLPGVTVDENKEIAIQGRSGVRILIDDRVQQLSGRQLENLLRSMNASNIEKIEVLKNPPVKYDAEGTGGMINIRTKKIKMYGFSGNADYTLSQGFYDVHNGSLSLNYKGKEIVFYSEVNVVTEKFYNDHVFYNKIKTDTNVTILDQRMDHFSGADAYAAIIGTDWLINKNNTIGIRVETEAGKGFEKSLGNNYISNNGLGFTRLKYDSEVRNIWDYYNFNLNAEHNFDTLGSKLNFSADYSPNFDIYPGTYDNLFLNDQDDQTLKPYYYVNNHVLKNNILSSKLDYIKKTRNEITFEAGIKRTETNVQSDYSFHYKDSISDEMVVDPLFTNSFFYKEQLAAGYFNFTKEWEGFGVQFGCRGENTHIETKNGVGSESVNRDYFNLFPALNLSYSKSEAHEFQLSYNRRIERPDYGNLSPFVYRNSLFQLYQGNPGLVPEYSNTFEFSHIFGGSLSNSVSYSLIDNFSMDYTIQNDSSKATIAALGNLSKADRMGYSIFFEGELNKWWTMSFNGNASYLRCSGTLLGQEYKSEGYFYMASLTNEFLIKGAGFEINGRYIGPRFNGIWFNQPRWGVFVAVKKSFLKEKLNVVVGVDDIFFTMIGANKVKYQDQDWSIRSTNDSRRLKISLSYNFGKVKFEQRDVISNEEEKGRLGK